MLDALVNHDPPLQVRLIPPGQSTDRTAGTQRWIAYVYPLGGKPEEHIVWVSTDSCYEALSDIDYFIRTGEKPAYRPPRSRYL